MVLEGCISQQKSVCLFTAKIYLENSLEGILRVNDSTNTQAQDLLIMRKKTTFGFIVLDRKFQLTRINGNTIMESLKKVTKFPSAM